MGYKGVYITWTCYPDENKIQRAKPVQKDRQRGFIFIKLIMENVVIMSTILKMNMFEVIVTRVILSLKVIVVSQRKATGTYITQDSYVEKSKMLMTRDENPNFTFGTITHALKSLNNITVFQYHAMKHIYGNRNMLCFLST